MRVSAVPYEVVDVLWDEAKSLLEPALKFAKRRFTIESVKEHIDGQYIALWVAMDDENKLKAAITTRVQEYPNGRALEMDWIGGEEMDKWFPQFQEKLEEYARSMKCDFMTGQGRKGWKKILQNAGWQEEHVSFRKDLTDE